MSSKNLQVRRQLWNHSNPQQTPVDDFRRHVNNKFSLRLSSYRDLWQWSVTDVGAFSAELWNFCEIRSSVPPTVAGIGLDKMWPPPKWFPSTRFNYTENLLHHTSSLQDKIAISACSEGGTNWKHVTWTQLYSLVGLWADALRVFGVTKGDRVAVVMTNCIESAVILLACGAIGAIFSSTSPDLGSVGIINRYQQVKPKILFVDSIVLYGGKHIDLRKQIRKVAAELKERSELQGLVFCHGPGLEVPGVRTHSMSDFLATAKGNPLVFEQVPFEHPIYILYSSGTTGPPKCICHSSGGALLQQKKEFMMSLSMGTEDCYYQYTTTGWMMWNYAIAALSCGTRLLLYDGSPLVPSCTRQLEIIESQGVSVWGTSPKFLSALRGECLIKLPTSLSLATLKVVASSGAPLTHQMFEWFYQVFPPQIGLCSGSGGTDLVGGIVMGTPLLPIYSGEIQACALGMKVEIWNSDGQNIEDSGEAGDLVITKPFLSMPVGFWGQDGDSKYYSTYFKQFPGVWYHGDFVKKNPVTGGYEVLGRSDGVLNPGGIRFGSAELYNVMEQFKTEVIDCIVVGRRRPEDMDETIMMFLKLQAGLKLSEALTDAIRQNIRTSLSPRHIPGFILQVKDIPYTANGKKVENAVRAIVSGINGKDSGTVVNPECLAEYRQFAKLEGSSAALLRAKRVAKI